MAVIVSQDVIRDIAQNLETGMKSWYHIPAGEVLSVPDRMKHYDIDYGLWTDTFDEIDEKMHECIAFECLEKHDEFRIMESFSDNEVSDKKLRARLITALSNRKPFRHFKYIIDNNSYRQAWFAFRLQWYINHVQEQLEFYNSKDKNAV